MADSATAYCDPETVIHCSSVSGRGPSSMLDMTAQVISDDPVCDFYTDHPYPPPVENLDRARDEWRNENRHRAEYHLFWPNKKYRSDLDILVAGCGTWQAAKYALCRPDAAVTGIDVSPTSLEHTERLKRKYNLKNLETRKLLVEDVSALGRTFDFIVCTGVLHHLADPDVGLAALRSALKPEGAIYLMVYAPYGRAGVYMIQEYCRRLGIGTSPQDVEDLVQLVKALPQHHPLSELLRGARDAANSDALADALMNPRDRSYSVPQLFDFIERNELRLGRWYWQAPYLPQCSAISATNHAAKLSALSEREQYAAMELFRGAMRCHSAIVFRNETPSNYHFDEESLLGYVPLRRPTTLCVQERLPHGASGVLINQSHPFTDLILVIDQYEKSIFDAIDGRRSVSEIVNRAGPTREWKRVRDFFKKLWSYDQVVFDTSNVT